MQQRLSQGTVLDGRFEIIRLIKKGGMGAVYEAADRKLNGKTFALKEIHPTSDTAELQEAKNRFISEIQVMQSLLHPSIPKISTAFIHENSFFFVMELIVGTDLSRKRRKEGDPGLPEVSVVAWALQVLDALEYLHAHSPPIVHRDIKPSNMLLRDSDQRVLLIDFGIARASNPTDGFWIGTPGYAPAEQQAGVPEPKSDLYALAASMHELLTGVKPKDFHFSTFEDLGVKVKPGLSDLLAETLEPFPEDRLDTAREMKERLEALNYPVVLPSTSRQHQFEEAVIACKRDHLDPALKRLMARYPNECQTPYLPKTLSFTKFALGTLTSFELLITKDPDRESIRFEEKQGILDAKPLGEVKPLEEDAAGKIDSIISRFADDYDGFKNSSWQIL